MGAGDDVDSWMGDAQCQGTPTQAIGIQIIVIVMVWIVWRARVRRIQRDGAYLGHDLGGRPQEARFASTGGDRVSTRVLLRMSSKPQPRADIPGFPPFIHERAHGCTQSSTQMIDPIKIKSA